MGIHGMHRYLPSVRLLYWLGDAERIIAASAKATLSPRDFVDIAENYADSEIENWIRELVIRGHGSPLEHSIYVFEVICSRVCSHQLVRHRHASYSQLSQRYSDKYLRAMLTKACRRLGVDYREDFKHYIDILTRLQSTGLGFEELLDILGEAFIVPSVVVSKKDAVFLDALLESTIAYYKALANGIPYEDARYLLPQAVKTRLVVSMNARELVEVFLPLRMCTRAQWEIRHVAWELWRQLMEKHPALFKYTGPRCVLMENRARQNPCTLIEYLEGKCQFTIERCPEKTPREKIQECILRALANMQLYYHSDHSMRGIQNDSQ